MTTPTLPHTHALAHTNTHTSAIHNYIITTIITVIIVVIVRANRPVDDVIILRVPHASRDLTASSRSSSSSSAKIA